jgi:hypothetical protein
VNQLQNPVVAIGRRRIPFWVETVVLAMSASSYDKVYR